MATSPPALSCDACGSVSEIAGTCMQCKEQYCKKCLKVHNVFGATKNHLTVEFVPLESKAGESNCCSCYELGNGNKPATVSCVECRELYCNECKQLHLQFRMTRHHTLNRLSTSTKHQSSEPMDSADLSSDFKDVTMTTDSESHGAKAAIFEGQIEQNLHHHSRKQLNKTELDNMSVNVITTFKGRVKRDKWHCDFTGIMCLLDGRIVLLDYENKSLKMFDSNFHMLFTEITEIKGRGMTKVSEEEIAVVGGQVVSFYMITRDKFDRQDKLFNLDADGLGISYNGYVYVIACSIFKDGIKGCEAFIKICSKTGQEIRRITSFKHKYSRIIGLDSDDERLYLSPHYANYKFACVTQHGQPKWELDFHADDGVDLYDCLLVTSMTDSALYLCSKDGTYKRALLQGKEHANKVQYIAYNPQTKRIFVTHGCASKRDIITVLQLSF